MGFIQRRVNWISTGLSGHVVSCSHKSLSGLYTTEYDALHMTFTLVSVYGHDFVAETLGALCQLDTPTG